MNEQNHDDRSATITLTWAQWIDVTASLQTRIDNARSFSKMYADSSPRDAEARGLLADDLTKVRNALKAKLDEVAEFQQASA